MNRTEHLLTIIAEECAEVSQCASKAARFGLLEVEPGQELTNAQRIIDEFNDLEAVITMLKWQPEFPCIDTNRQHANRLNKEQKVRKFLDYSAQIGTLQEEA